MTKIDLASFRLKQLSKPKLWWGDGNRVLLQKLASALTTEMLLPPLNIPNYAKTHCRHIKIVKWNGMFLKLQSSNVIESLIIIQLYLKTFSSPVSSEHQQFPRGVHQEEARSSYIHHLESSICCHHFFGFLLKHRISFWRPWKFGFQFSNRNW